MSSNPFSKSPWNYLTINISNLYLPTFTSLSEYHSHFPKLVTRTFSLLPGCTSKRIFTRCESFRDSPALWSKWSVFACTAARSDTIPNPSPTGASEKKKARKISAKKRRTGFKGNRKTNAQSRFIVTRVVWAKAATFYTKFGSSLPSYRIPWGREETLWAWVGLFGQDKQRLSLSGRKSRQWWGTWSTEQILRCREPICEFLVSGSPSGSALWALFGSPSRRKGFICVGFRICYRDKSWAWSLLRLLKDIHDNGCESTELKEREYFMKKKGQPSVSYQCSLMLLMQGNAATEPHADKEIQPTELNRPQQVHGLPDVCSLQMQEGTTHNPQSPKAAEITRSI